MNVFVISDQVFFQKLEQYGPTAVVSIVDSADKVIGILNDLYPTQGDDADNAAAVIKWVAAGFEWVKAGAMGPLRMITPDKSTMITVVSRKVH